MISDAGGFCLAVLGDRAGEEYKVGKKKLNWSWRGRVLRELSKLVDLPRLFMEPIRYGSWRLGCRESRKADNEIKPDNSQICTSVVPLSSFT